MLSTNWNLSAFKSTTNKLVILVAVLEVVFFFSPTMVTVVAMTLLNWWIAYNFVFTAKNLQLYPLSTFTLIGYCFFFIIMPAPATLMEFKSVIYNLKNPVETFAHISLLFVVLVLTHDLYKKIVRKNPLRNAFKKMHFYNSFSKSEVWALSVFALFIVSINIMFYGRWLDEDVSVNKPLLLELISPVTIFLYLPLLFLFPCYKLINNVNKVKYVVLICLFAIVLFVIGISSNVRTMALSFLTLGLAAFLFAYLSGLIKIKSKPKIVIFIIIAAWFFTGPFMDLSLSMVIVRGEKTGVSGIELFNKTLEVYKDKPRLKAYKNLMSNERRMRLMDDWDETYIDNDILARFCSVKTIDETIYYANKIGFSNTQMREEYERQIYAIFPDVICNAFGMTTEERNDIKSYSLTDYLYTKATGSTSGLGSFKIGSFQGLGLAIFGYAYLLVAIPIFFILFLFFESTVLITNDGVRLSVWTFLNLFLIFYITVAGHNFQTDTKYIIRGFFESILFYYISLFIAKKIIQLFRIK